MTSTIFVKKIVILITNLIIYGFNCAEKAIMQYYMVAMNWHAM